MRVRSLAAASAAAALVWAMSGPSSARPGDPPSPAPSASAGSGAAGAPVDPRITARAERWMRLMEAGTPDRSELTPSMNAALPETIVALVAAQYGPLGDPTSFVYERRQRVAGGTAYVYRATFSSQSVVWIFALDDRGKVSGLHFFPPDAER